MVIKLDHILNYGHEESMDFVKVFENLGNIVYVFSFENNRNKIVIKINFQK